MSLNERPTTKLKWAFCFFGEHFMAATKTETFMNVTILPINIDDTDKATEIEGIGISKVMFPVSIFVWLTGFIFWNESRTL